MKKIPPYNPLSKENLGLSVAQAALHGDISKLPPERFTGAGVYLIYYIGDFEPYSEFKDYNSDKNVERPIYIGKAIPAGARKGGIGLGEEPGDVLFKRLKEHADSITKAENLEIADFVCRYLVVDDIWIPLAESLLINMFKPVWNNLVDGFGNHDPGSGRYNQKKSLWDSLHPGRNWANKLKPSQKNYDEVAEEVREYLKYNPE